MRAYLGVRGTGLLAGAILLAAAALFLAQAAAESSHPVTFTVTSVGGDGRPGGEGDVQLRVRNQATRSRAGEDENLFLAILIDDNIATAREPLERLRRSSWSSPHDALAVASCATTDDPRQTSRRPQLAANALRPPMACGRPRALPRTTTCSGAGRRRARAPSRADLSASTTSALRRGADLPRRRPARAPRQEQNTNSGHLLPGAVEAGRSFQLRLTGSTTCPGGDEDGGATVYSWGRERRSSLQPLLPDSPRNLRSQYS